MIPHRGPRPSALTQRPTSMDLNFTPEELAFRDEVRAFLREQLPADIAQRDQERSVDPRRGLHALAEDPLQARLGCAGWPKQFGGPGWGPVADAHLRRGSRRRRRAALDPVRPEDGRAGDHGVRHRRRSSSASCRASSAARTGGVRATPSRARAPTSRRSRRAPSARAITTSSTARRPGTRSASTPTGSSAWCAPIRTRRSSSRASRSC